MSATASEALTVARRILDTHIRGAVNGVTITPDAAITIGVTDTEALAHAGVALHLEHRGSFVDQWSGIVDDIHVTLRLAIPSGVFPTRTRPGVARVNTTDPSADPRNHLTRVGQVLADIDSRLPEGITVNVDWTGGVTSIWLTNRAAAMTLMHAIDDLGARRTMPGFETWRGTVRGLPVRICLADANRGRVAA